MNNVVLIGRLTRDPELRYLPNGGNAVARFTLAVDKQLSREKRAEMESRNQPTADFINIVVWGKQAENVNNFLVKGRLCAVSGRIQTGSYDAKDGTKRYTTDVVADRVQFLEWGDSNPGAGGGGYSQPSGGSNNMDDIDGFYTIDNEDIPF
ncbi:MAG: single-stranded DNA-binding protein [Tissierellia bacterium]|nr:single-stranded DNA-binding protein [Tissierellia bacterium]